MAVAAGDHRLGLAQPVAHLVPLRGGIAGPGGLGKRGSGLGAAVRGAAREQIALRQMAAVRGHQQGDPGQHAGQQGEEKRHQGDGPGGTVAGVCFVDWIVFHSKYLKRYLVEVTEILQLKACADAKNGSMTSTNEEKSRARMPVPLSPAQRNQRDKFVLLLVLVIDSGLGFCPLNPVLLYKEPERN
jgi:hypothetical protein